MEVKRCGRKIKRSTAGRTSGVLVAETTCCEIQVVAGRAQGSALLRV